jgi:hypothetical protein
VAYAYTMADTDSYPSADLHTVPNLHSVADTHTYFGADIYAVSDFHPVADSYSRADLHAIPDLHAMAYVDTHTCSHCHGSTYADADCDCAYTDYGSINADTGGYGDCRTNAHSDRYTYTGSAHADTYAKPSANGDRCTDSHSDPDASPNCDAYADSHAECRVRYQMGHVWHGRRAVQDPGRRRGGIRR